MSTKVKTEVINNYRKENNLTVEQFCQKCNISKSAYYKFMNNQIDKVKISVLYNIAVTLNVLCKYLLDYDD
ncbi:MAG: helix-turn-helix domain-containing protein [Clostridia bacterium]|nr:helix-turn-helix domain-containing protein [Clostridia bacterium]